MEKKGNANFGPVDCLSLFRTGALEGFERNAWIDLVGFLLLGRENGAAGRLVFVKLAVIGLSGSFYSRTSVINTLWLLVLQF